MKITAILAIFITLAACNSPRLVKAPSYSPDLCRVGKTYVSGPDSIKDDYTAIIAYIGNSTNGEKFATKFNEMVDYRCTGCVTQVEYKLGNGVVMVVNYQSLSYCREVYSKLIDEMNNDPQFGEVHFSSKRNPFKYSE